jgi:hypothetical protein
MTTKSTKALWGAAALAIGVSACTGDLGGAAERDVDQAAAALPTTSEEAVSAVGVQIALERFAAFPDGQAATLAAGNVRLARTTLCFVPHVNTFEDGSIVPWEADWIVESLAWQGVTLLPALIGCTPEYRAAAIPPSQLGLWQSFAFSIARRYGPDGAFWSERPDVPYAPIRAWEVWNEPNLEPFWGGEPQPRRYRRILRHARIGLRQADPRARVVLGGLFAGGGSWDGFLRDVLHGRDAEAERRNGCLFDAVAIHPYGNRVDDAIDKVRAAHQLLEERGLTGKDPAEDAQLWITELGWAVPDPCWPWCKQANGEQCGELEDFTAHDEGAQAERVTKVVAALDDKRGAWRLGPLVWYMLEDLAAQPKWDHYAGLFAGSWAAGAPRPAWWRLHDAAVQHGPVALAPVRCPDPDGSLAKGFEEDERIDGMLDDENVVGVHRAWSQAQMNHLYATNAADLADHPSYTVEAYDYFRLFRAPGDALAPLYRCKIDDSGWKLLTSDAGCEGSPGAVNQGLLGYMVVSGLVEPPPLVPLYRLFHPDVRNHFFTTNDEERYHATTIGYRDEGLVGWVMPGG